MEAVPGRVLLGHHLDGQRPAREVPLLDAVVEVALVALPALADRHGGLLIGEVLYALLGAEVELDPVPLVPRIDHTEGVAAEAVHMPVGGRDAPVAHHDRDLVQCLRQRRPEVPVVESAPEIGARVALDRVVEVGELEGIAQEEDRRVVAHQVPVALVGVELDREAPDVALGVGGAALAGDRGETHEEIGLLSDLGEDARLGVAGDVAGDGEGAVGTRPLGVHTPLGNHLAVEVGELLQEPDVLQQHRPARSGGDDVLVVDDGSADAGGQFPRLALLRPVFPAFSALPGASSASVGSSQIPSFRVAAYLARDRSRPRSSSPLAPQPFSPAGTLGRRPRRARMPCQPGPPA